jgi:uncharacterized membrane protein YfcA
MSGKPAFQMSAEPGWPMISAVTDLLFAPVVVFIGYLVLGVAGFGSALVIVPLLAWKWPLHQVVPLALLLDVPASMLQTSLNWKQVEFAEFTRLLVPILVGSLVGVWLASAVDPRWPLLALGLYVAAAGGRALVAHGREQPRAHESWRPLAGFGTGLIEVMFATAGPIVLAWLQRRLTSVYAVRATTPLTILVAATIALAVMGVKGTLSNLDLWTRWLTFIGIAALGVYLGNRLARHVPAALLRRIICALLVLSGLALASRAWL